MKIISFLKRHIDIVCLTVASLLTHLFLFGFPNEAVFDEVYFTSFISNYFTHNYFFDIHPPFAKLLIAGVGYLAGFQPLSHELVIGESFGTASFIWLRLLPVIAGIVLPIIVYKLCKEFKLSRAASLAAGFLIIFESSLLVQSRFVLLDSLLLAFGFFGLLLYFIHVRNQKFWVKLLSVVFLTFAFSIKWTGGTFFAIVILLEIIRLTKNRLSIHHWIRSVSLFFIVPTLIYFSFFAIHLSLLWKTGPGDAFMSKAFQKTLEGNINNGSNIDPLGLGEKAAELNFEMYRSNARLTATHPYGSKWYTWPLMERPVFYWQHQTSPTTNQFIYLFGNPFIYWSSTIAVILSIIFLAYAFIKRRVKYNRKLGVFLLFAYLFNLLPFIGITRVMFLYHYFTALVFAIITLVFLIDMIENEKTKKKAFISVVVISALFFIYFSPIIYGISISQSSEHLFFWISSWR